MAASYYRMRPGYFQRSSEEDQTARAAMIGLTEQTDRLMDALRALRAHLGCAAAGCQWEERVGVAFFHNDNLFADRRTLRSTRLMPPRLAAWIVAQHGATDG